MRNPPRSRCRRGPRKRRSSDRPFRRPQGRPEKITRSLSPPLVHFSMDLLRGAIDTHVHSFPDVVARKLDDLALVEQARAAGMRGILLKSHVFSTAERAWLLRKLYPDFLTFGGITLNHSVGGLNPKAVEAALKLGAVQVWMPTLSA